LIYLVFKAPNAVANAAAISFKLGFTWTPSAYPSRETRKGRVVSGNQPGKDVLQLRKLYLDLTFPALGALRKNIQNQLCPVYHL
jgi:hypothetical protein